MKEIVLFKGDKQAGLAKVKDPQADRSVSPAGEPIVEGAPCHRPWSLDGEF